MYGIFTHIYLKKTTIRVGKLFLNISYMDPTGYKAPICFMYIPHSGEGRDFCIQISVGSFPVDFLGVTPSHFFDVSSNRSKAGRSLGSAKRTLLFCSAGCFFGDCQSGWEWEGVNPKWPNS